MEAAYGVPFLTCGNCRKPLPWEVSNSAGLSRCPYCNIPTYSAVFPALFRPTEQGRPGETLLTDGEASCYYHPHKKAVVACVNCGRFLCALCDLDFNGQHLCSQCLETNTKKKSIQTLENRRILYDDLALSLAIVPMLIFYLTLITAPITLYLSIRYWNAPSSIIPRGKTRFVLAIMIALLQMGGWIAIVFVIFRATR